MECSSSHDTVMTNCIDRLRLYVQKPRENEDQIRTITSKLLQTVKAHDKLSKDPSLRSAVQQNIWLFFSILQSTENVSSINNLISVLQELVSNKSTKRETIAALLELETIPVLFRVLPYVTRDAFCPETILPACFYIMAKVSKKDPRFSSKVRSCGGLRIMASIIKCNVRNSVLLKHLVQVLRACVMNGKNCNLLGKEGIVAALLNVINGIGRKPTFLMKITLETIGYLSRTKSNVQRIVKSNGVPRLLYVLDQWDKYEGENKRRICKANLVVLGNVADTKGGQRAIADTGGITSLYKFCNGLPHTGEHDQLLLMASGVLQRCLPQKKLPVSSLENPYSFSLPMSKSSITRSIKRRNVDKEEDDDDDFSSSDSDIDRGKSGEVTKSKSKELSPSSSDSCIIELPTWREENLWGYRQHFKELQNDTLAGEMNLTKSASMSSPSLSRHNSFGTKIEKDTLKPFFREKYFDKGLLHRENIYKRVAQNTKHVNHFVKLAYPEMQSGEIYEELEPLYEKDPAVCRKRLLESLNQALNPPKFVSKSVFDLDSLIASGSDAQILDNDDEDRVGKPDPTANTLRFESRFESGNLRKAVQVGQYDYELFLTPDVNSNNHYQWFYFEVSNMDSESEYNFHIVNCEKLNSQFNFGMRPVFYSVKEAMLGKPGWIRAGSDICYYRNVYLREGAEDGPKCFYTTSFNIKFKHANDVCYIAYHYPYTYSLLQTDIEVWKQMNDPESIYFMSEEYCKSLGGNLLPVLTITSPKTSGRDKLRYIFLSGRVHPGESNSSWVMKGSIDFLLSEKPVARSLRDMYIFKIVPMLNPDGVINGCHRCDLTAEDLNRTWHKPCPVLQPTIYHTKGLLLYLQSINKTPLVYCDYHGHSRKKNIFLYGCSSSQSWREIDRSKPDEKEYELIPRLLQHMAPAFSYDGCLFSIEKLRESTARVAVWRQIGVTRSYTMESSYCGCDEGPYQGMHLGIRQLEEMGQKFVQSLVHVRPDRPYPAASFFTGFLQRETPSSMTRLIHHRRKSTDDSSCNSDDSNNREDNEP